MARLGICMDIDGRDAIGGALARTHMAHMNGAVKRLVRDKGVGFIGGGRGVEYFFPKRFGNARARACGLLLDKPLNREVRAL